MKKVYIETLGCSKNDVDSALMQSILDKEKYDMTKDPETAEIILINTCGFIDSAKEESIDTALRLGQLKSTGRLEKLVLAGCLAQRYAEELLESLPEVDGILGTGSVKDLNQLLEEIEGCERSIVADDINDEYLESLRREEVGVTEYVKISEGCDNRCTYCIIPALRGDNRSRKIEDIVREVEDLVMRGAREIILIAQNTTDYGMDLYQEPSLAKLLRALRPIRDLKWIRVLYLYPDRFTEELVQEFVDNEKLVHYVDIPLQHVSDHVLRRMNRRTKKADILSLIEKLRRDIPDITIRTTFIVGFPGETEEDFEELMAFIRLARFDKLGAFAYSKEEGTPAAEWTDQVEDDVKEERLDRLMSEQQKISADRLRERVGTTLEVLIEESTPEGGIGRSVLDIPDIDGVVFVQSMSPCSVTTFVKVRVIDSLEYDLIAEVCE